MDRMNHIFTFDAVVETQATKDPETLTFKPAVKTIIKCFKVGKLLHIRDEKGYRDVNAMMYLFKADADVKIGYRIDGQLVQVVNVYNKPGNRRHSSGSTKLLEVYTYA